MFTRSHARSRQAAPGLRGRLLGGAVFVAIALPSGALAQDVIEELVVTAPNYVSSGSVSATKTAAPLIETPQSVTVISRDQIDLLNVTSLQQSVRYTAGVVGENFGPDERYDWLTLRGFNPIQYIDGLQAPIGSVANVGTDLYGFESVDILKGPSSVLYGQTPPGGLVNMTSRRPQRSFGGEIEGQLGNYEHKQIAADVTGPLGENFSGRFTVLHRDRGTQMDFVESKRTYVAPALTWDIAPSTRITFLGYFQKDDIEGDGGGFLPAYGTSLPNPFGKIPVGRNLGEPDYNYYRREQYGVGWDLAHDFNEDVTFQQNLKYFSAVSSMRSVYGAGLVDADFNGVPDDFRTVNRYNFPFEEDVNSFNVDNRISVSLKTGGLEHAILAGVDYRRYDLASEFGFAFGPQIDLFNPVYGAPITTPTFFPYVNQVEKQTGVYIQDQIRTGAWTFTASGRQDWVKTENFGSKKEADEFSYRLGANYVFESGIAPYVSFARSFMPTAGADFFGVAFEPATGEQVEAGVKYDGRGLPDDVKVFATAAAYKLTQQNVLTQDPDPTHPFFNVQAGEVEVQGIELEAVARIRERVSINASYSYTDSEVTKSNGPDLGKRLTMVPEHKVSLLVDYTAQTGSLAGLGGGVGVRYLSSTFGDAANLWKNEDVTLWDAMIHYDTEDWRAAINASNLFDEKYVARCSSAVDCFYGTRRLVSVSLTRKF
ncbi:TonB-dependent siderophore receptor [Phenylobacterium sp.]|uniref:TonB-dependent siderophore receptor n=1 Tax=Phenylobacterium sp. TaxID=1871053 RepID=UPI002FC5CD1D